MSLKSISFAKELWQKPFISRAKQVKKKKSDTRSCRQKTAEDYYAKINVSPNIPCTILPFKASAFFQIFFRRNLPFRQVLRRSVFLSVVKNTHSLKWLRLDSNPEPLIRKRTFVNEHSMIWLNWPNYWAVFWVLICMVYLKYDVSKNKPLLYP